MPARPLLPRAIRGLAIACFVLALLLAAELVARIAAGWRGAGHDPERVRAELHAAATRVDATRRSGLLSPAVTKERGILHPYTGWQPEADPGGVFAWFGEGPRAGELGVVVLGGRTALAFAGTQRIALARELEQRLEPAGTRVRILPLAVDGWKEPQPLLAFSFLLTSGIRPAAVVVLDGWEELEIGLENAAAGFHPIQPDAETWPPLVLERGAFSPAELDAGTALWEARTSAAARIGSALSSRFSSHSALVSSIVLARVEDAVERVERLRAELDQVEREQREKRLLRPELRGPDFEPDPCAAIAFSARSWEEAARSLRALCGAHGIPLVHVLAPRARPASTVETGPCTIEDHGRGALALSMQRLERDGVPVRDAAGVAGGSPALADERLALEIALDLAAKLSRP